jgi:hypothetical protein
MNIYKAKESRLIAFNEAKQALHVNIYKAEGGRLNIMKRNKLYMVSLQFNMLVVAVPYFLQISI